MLKNRKVAFAICIPVMVIFAIVGAAINLNRLSNPAQGQFDEEMRPLLLEALRFSHEVHFLADNLDGVDLDNKLSIFESANIQESYQVFNELAESTHASFTQINSPSDMLTASHRNFNEIVMILSQARYNHMARAFNVEAGRSWLPWRTLRTFD